MEVEAIDSGAKLRAATRLMLAGLIVMLAAIFTLYFTPLVTAPLIAAALYIGLWRCEQQAGVASPITRVMAIVYLLLTVTRYGFEDQSWMIYAVPAVHGILAALIFALLLAGKPFTAFYAGEQGFPPLQGRMSLMWGGLHGAAGCATLILIPEPSFIYTSLALMVFGAIATVWLNFISMGPAYERQLQFDLAGYVFREAISQPDRELFYRVIARAYQSDLQTALGARRKLNPAMIIREHRVSDGKRQGSFMPFLVFDDEQPVGGICIFFDHKEQGLPIESEAQIDLVPWRRVGPIAEVGRLGLLQRYRFNPILLKGLFKCVVEAAAEKNIHFIFNDSFAFQAGLYEKIGFIALLEKPYISADERSTGYGLQVLPMIMNLADMIRMDVKNNTTSDLRNILAAYVIERFFKRLTIRETIDILFHSKHRSKGLQNVRA